MTSSRVRAPRGSSPVAAPPVDTPVDIAVVDEVPAVVVDDRIEGLVAEVEALGWHVTVEPMRVFANRDGFAPVSAMCSSSYDAARLVHERLVLSGEEPLRKTKAPPAPAEASEDPDAEPPV